MDKVAAELGYVAEAREPTVAVLSLGHGLTGGGHGAHAHDLGIHAALAPADQLGHGLQTVLGHSLAGGQHDGGSAVVDAGGVGGGNALGALIGSILAACRPPSC